MTRRPLVPEDLLRFAIPEDVEIRPDGREIYYVHQTMDAEDNRYRRIIRVIDADTRSARNLTQGPQDHTPRCAPDGRHLAFVRTADEVQGVWVLPFYGGEPRPLEDWAYDASNPVWFPDGENLLVEVELDGEALPPSVRAHTRQQEAAGAHEKYTRDVRCITRAFYRLDTVGYLHTERHRQLVKLRVDGDGAPMVVTHGPYHHSQAAIHPGGHLIACQSNRQKNPDREPYDDIVLVDAATGHEQVITDGRGSYGSPHFSPDGTWLYFFGHDYREGFYSQTQLYRIAVTDGQPTRPELIWAPGDGDFGNEAIDDMHAHGPSRLTLGFSADRHLLYALYSTHGAVQMAEWNVETRQMRLLTQGERVIYAFRQDCSHRHGVLLEADADSPGNVYGVCWEGPHLQLRRLTDLNRELLDEVELFRPQHFTFHSEPLGDEMDGWFVVPSGPGPYPLALQVHGGPMAMYAPTFFLEFQVLAGAGIGLVFTNPHGSRGYGESFCASIKGAWGGKDFRDVMAGLDRALNTKHYDDRRLAILGGSYGGFMTSWAIGHTDRFRAAVTMRSVVDELSFFGTSDIGYMDDWEWGTTPWQNPERYWERSPLMAVTKMTAPLLIIHAEEDWRCPISQAEELFQALKWLDRDVTFARFPGESHELSRSGKPWHRVKRLELIRDWLTQHLAPR